MINITCSWLRQAFLSWPYRAKNLRGEASVFSPGFGWPLSRLLLSPAPQATQPYRCSGSYLPLLKCGCDRAIQQQDPTRQFWSWCWHRDTRVSTRLQFWIIYCGFYCGFWHPAPACEKWGAPDYSTQWSLTQRHYEKLDNNAGTILMLYLFV